MSDSVATVDQTNGRPLTHFPEGFGMVMVKADGVKILMVDDKPQKLLAYEAMLESLGEKLLRATSGNDAFEILLQQPDVAVILLDVNMPGMDGFETASAIRQHPRFSRMPIIFVTAVNTTDLDRIRGYELGAVDYVSVPVVPEILRAKVSVFAELYRKTRELERLNQALTESEQHLRAIVNTAQEAIITMDVAGVIQSVNPATERIFGYAAAELIGQHMQMLVPAAYRDELDGAINKNQTPRWNLAGATREFHGLHKDGTHLNLEIGVSEVLPGKVYTGILRDISPRKKLEREVTEISAREQYRIGQELHDGVSQEVTGLTLMATTLRDQLKEERSACEPSAERLMAGLRQVHKRIRAISHGLVPVDVDAEGLRSALEDFVDRIRQQTEVACEFHCPRPVLVKDSLTATNLFYIVQEAVNNALRHGRAGAIDIFLHSRPDALVLTVRDDGVGIVSEENQAKGIGMRLMNHRANLVGGMLRVHSNGERGTVVTCTISHHGRQDD